jgi:GAF domain-containing protein
VQIPDVLEEATYELKLKKLGFRSILSVPMLRNSTPIGAIAVSRDESGQFSEKQIALLQTFADQAVTTDVQPVFEAIVRRASSLCGGEYAIVTRYFGMMLHLAAQHNPRPGADVEVSKFFPQVPRRDGAISGRALVNRAVVHISDIEAEQLDAVAHDAYRRMGLRAVIAVPMLDDGHSIGVVAVSRETPGPFSARANTVGGTVSPRGLASCITGRSIVLAPL